MTDEFGDRMKLYEGAEADRRFMPLLPVMARLDGRAFHTFTRSLDRPFDENFCKLMQMTCCYLVEETNACCGYTQSDEITLTWYSDSVYSQIFFDGRIMKMTSILAAMATAYFNDHKIMLPVPGRSVPITQLANFDCRCWQVPNKVEGANVFLWRELDATKNSIQSLAQSLFSHNELQGLHGNQLQEKMFTERGANWNDLPDYLKRGTYFQRQKVVRKFYATELDKLPAQHAARKNPDLEVERRQVEILQMPPFSRVCNRPEVIYDGHAPMLAKDE